MESPETRTCTRCGIEKPIEEFGFKYRERGIRQSWCKPCYVEYKRVWYLENREKHIAELMTAYVKVHPAPEYHVSALALAAGLFAKDHEAAAVDARVLA